MFSKYNFKNYIFQMKFQKLYFQNEISKVLFSK